MAGEERRGGLLRWAGLSLLLHGALALGSLDWRWTPRPALRPANDPVLVRVLPASRPEPTPELPPARETKTAKPARRETPPPAPAEPPNPQLEPPPEARPAPAPERQAAARPEPTPQPRPAPAPAPAPQPEPAAKPARARSPETSPATAPPAPDPAAPEPAEPAKTAALAPPPVSAARPTAPPQSGADQVAAYIELVRRRIEERKWYPSLARRQGLEGRVAVRLSIDADGRLAAVETTSSDFALLEQAARAAVEQAAPFPPPPAGFGDLEIAVRYTLE